MEETSEVRAGGEVLLILTSWSPPGKYLEYLQTISPGIKIIVHTCPARSTQVPTDVPVDIWSSVTILLTWKIVPPPDLTPKLKFVQLICAGSSHVLDSALFKQTSVSFCTASGVHPPQVTEWVFATFLGFQHHLPAYLHNQRNRIWEYPESDETTEDAVGLRAGILGYGSIGRQCARVARAFGMDVHAYTLRERSTPEARKDNSFTESGLGDYDGIFPSRWYYGPDQLHEFLASDLDLLVITLPLTPATKGMLSLREFQILSKKKPFISNVGRGPIIETEDLMTALDEGLIRGAVLDVTEPEPLPEGHNLWAYENVIITPHCGGTSTHYNERVLKILAQNIERTESGNPLINQVDRIRRY